MSAAAPQLPPCLPPIVQNACSRANSARNHRIGVNFWANDSWSAIMRTPLAQRSISPQELDVLRHVLRRCRTCNALPIHDLIAENLIVSSLCECGCDTVDFKVSGNTPPTIIADGLGDTPDGDRVGIIVFGTPDAITCLEVYSFDDVPGRLPTLDSIRPFGPHN